MLIVLRKIRRAAGRVTATEWLLLAIEALVVAVGILIAFEIEEWAQDRRDERQVERGLVRLFEETQDALGVYLTHTYRSIRILNKMSADAQILQDNRCPADFEAITLFDYEFIAHPSRAAFDEFVAKIGTSAIPNKRVREALNDFDIETANYRYLMSRVMGSPLLGADDERVQYVAGKSSITPGVDGGISSTLPDNPEDMSSGFDFFADYEARRAVKRSYDRDALCSDKAFRNKYVAAMGRAELMYEYSANMLVATADLCFALADEIGRECYDSPRMRQAPDDHKKFVTDMRERYRVHPLWGPDRKRADAELSQ